MDGQGGWAVEIRKQKTSVVSNPSRGRAPQLNKSMEMPENQNSERAGIGSTTLFGDFPTQRTTSDCFSACLSWLLGLPQDDVPDFTGPDDGFYRRVAEWLRPRGLRMLLMEWDSLPAMLGGPIIARGMTRRRKYHAVLWDDNGLLHDPHPSRAGFSAPPTHAMLILIFANSVINKPSSD